MILDALQSAKGEGYKYLCSASLILQVLMPGAVSIFDGLDSNSCGEDELCAAMDISLDEMLSSSLLCHIISNWYDTARPRMEMNDLERRLSCKFNFRPYDWPCVNYDYPYNPTEAEGKMPSASASASPSRGTNNGVKKPLPLLQGSIFIGRRKDDKPRIKALPISYTDLYAELGILSPKSEATAVCLVCGEVLSADGKGECTKHAWECGGGCGIFFLLQKCYVLIIHKEKAMYVGSPYVDSHGETPHYRGRPLFMDVSRYNSLHELWSGHLTRDRVISERSKYSPHQLPDNGFY